MNKYFLFLIWIFAQFGFASIYSDFQVGGDCTKFNTSFIESGDSFSVIFHELDIRMPKQEPGDGLRTLKLCDFKVKIANPPGQYLALLKQVVSGGAIKSANAQGELVIRSTVSGLDMSPKSIQWLFGKAITPESSDSIFIRESQARFPKTVNCRNELPFQTRFLLRASRSNTSNDYFIGAVDSWDVEGISRVRIIPVFQSCSSRINN